MGNNKDNNIGLFKSLFSIKGDKVIVMIVLLLLLFSVLTIFSSTPLLPAQESRLATMKSHGMIVILGIGLIILLYNIKISWIKKITQLGFGLSFIMLLLLLMRIDIPGVIKTQTINGALRNFLVAGYQVHVFEVVKVLMILYIAWATNAIQEDRESRKEKKIGTLKIADWLGRRFKRLKILRKCFGKRLFYIYIPSVLICFMVMMGSGSSAIFIGLILLATMIIGGVPIKEIVIAGAIALALLGGVFGLHFITGGGFMPRAGTMMSRMSADYDMNRLEGLDTDETYEMLDIIEQPVSAKIAVHQGGVLGKGIGNSTQKYQVTNIYGDYMYSFIIEEYGLGGGILILILYISLLARCSIIARMISDEYAKYVLGGLAILITGQALLHILVNVDLGPMTGQTLPLISHGASAFLIFCCAFGMILSISRMAKDKIRTVEEMTETSKDDLAANIEAAEKENE